ncbi:hypothetical protein HK405_005098 [Cladochytrium tenue]|nr:hypothetical protein HK405_005098 [Cladochytrium tenue]
MLARIASRWGTTTTFYRAPAAVAAATAAVTTAVTTVAPAQRRHFQPPSASRMSTTSAPPPPPHVTVSLLGQDASRAIDEELMGPDGGFDIHQVTRRRLLGSRAGLSPAEFARGRQTAATSPLPPHARVRVAAL